MDNDHGRMSVAGLCQVCEAAQAAHQCDLCGTLVCTVHFERRTGRCVDCTRGVGATEEDLE